ncbi:MAG: O-antigen ligase family protein [Planctomycetes bacterium]|nr:O-antigen ligase family protein [Planctomycetota bacterium]
MTNLSGRTACGPSHNARSGQLCTSTIAPAAPAESPIRRLTKITTIRERLTYWRIAVEIGSESPWLGRSPGAFQLFYPRHKPPTARESRYAHSWVFQTGSELGLVGLGLFGLFWLGVAKAGVSVYRCRPSTVGAEETAIPAQGSATFPGLSSGVAITEGATASAITRSPPAARARAARSSTGASSAALARPAASSASCSSSRVLPGASARDR